MRRYVLVLILLAAASFPNHPIQAQLSAEEQSSISTTTQDRLVVFEAFMRPT